MGHPAARPIKLRCLHYLLQPFFHVFRRHIFHVSGNSPQMSEWILNEARAVAVKLVLNRFQDFSAFGHRTFDHAVDVGKVHVETYRAGADGGRAGVSLSCWDFRRPA